MAILVEDSTQGVEEDSQKDSAEQEEDQEEELCQQEDQVVEEDQQGKQGHGVKSFARFVIIRGPRQEFLRATPGQGVAEYHSLSRRLSSDL